MFKITNSFLNQLIEINNQSYKLPFVILFIFYCIFSYSPIGASVFWWIQKEDGLLETASVIFLFLASLAMLWCYFYGINTSKKQKNIYLFLSIFLFFWAGEEISWGQRLFGYSIDLIASNNSQSEVTLHNLYIVQDFLHFLYFIVFGFVSLLCLNTIFKTPLISPLLLPSAKLFYFFCLPAIYYGLGSLLSFFPDFVDTPFANQEMYEFLLALGTFIYAYDMVGKNIQEL